MSYTPQYYDDDLLAEIMIHASGAEGEEAEQAWKDISNGLVEWLETSASILPASSGTDAIREFQRKFYHYIFLFLGVIPFTLPTPIPVVIGKFIFNNPNPDDFQQQFIDYVLPYLVADPITNSIQFTPPSMDLSIQSYFNDAILPYLTCNVMLSQVAYQPEELLTEVAREFGNFILPYLTVNISTGEITFAPPFLPPMSNL